MTPVVKFTEAIEDRTAQEATLSSGFEAVLFDEVQTNNSGLSALDVSSVEDTCDPNVLEMIQKGRWVELSQLVVATPAICRARLPSSENLVLHEACKAKAPLWFVDVLVRNNKDALTKKGQGGYLPLHFACANHASADVIAFLISEFTGSIHVVENSERMLPLHLASKHGISEDAMMVLLSSFPEATMVKDGFGRTPMDFARNQSDTPLRNATISYLERAGWLCSASAAARHWAELAHNKKLDELEQKMNSAVDQIESGHKAEKTDLVSKVNALEAIVALKQEKIETLEKMIKSQTSELGSDVDREHPKVVTLRQELEEREAELAKAVEKMANLEVTFQAQIRELEDSHKKSFEEAKTKFEEEKVAFDAIVSTLREEKASLEEKTSEKANEVERLENQNKDIEQNLKTMVEQIAMLQNVVGETKASLEQANTRLVKSTIRNSELVIQLETKEAERVAAIEETEELRLKVEYLSSLMTSIRHLAGTVIPGPTHTWNKPKKNASRVFPEIPTEQMLKKSAVPTARNESNEQVGNESRIDDLSIGDNESMITSSRE